MGAKSRRFRKICIIAFLSASIVGTSHAISEAEDIDPIIGCDITPVMEIPEPVDSESFEFEDSVLVTDDIFVVEKEEDYETREKDENISTTDLILFGDDILIY